MTLQSQIIERLDAIPPLSPTVSRLIGLLADEDRDAREVEAIVCQDPGLAVAVLRMANSALYSRGFEVTSVREALMRLGSMQVLAIALSHAVASVARAPLSGYALSEGALWIHCVGVAVCASELSGLLGVRDDGSIYSAGLLHDIGKIALAAFVREEASRFEREDAPFDELEREVLGIDHADLGAELLERWKLPRLMVEVARFHHRPDCASDAMQSVVRAVHLADHLCRGAGLGLGMDGLRYLVSPAVLDALGGDEGVFAVALSATLEKLDALDEVLELGLRAPVTP